MAKKRPTRATSHDVARLAGVSQAAVSRAFSAGSSISKDKRERVLKAAHELHYVPNKLASSLSTARSNMVAVIVGNLNNPFYSESLQAFVTGFQESGRQVLAFSVTDAADGDEVVQQAVYYPVDAIVVTAAPLSSKLLKISAGLGIPIVMFNRHLDSNRIAGVHCDNRGAGARIAEAMHSAGAERFLIVRGDPEGSTSRDRVEGFRTYLLARGVPPTGIEEIDGASSYGASRDSLRARFRAGDRPRPDAIYAVSDIMALGCLDALRTDLGLRVPGDVMLAGSDGIRQGRLSAYDLTTIRQPIEQMVATTLQMLESAEDLKNPDMIQVLELPGEFIPGSTVPRPPRDKP
ncbi:LacI family DNA-binding transcriptional regulator [Roseisalinus antarcticus]|uniref:HTH-type transcriptional regulator DegA n=1 Tax=Roseisalinus antarcticus TaxID=254357 RepID=A0A1Y5RYK8_9RHOB|nr:LacI family DNA-binding transcriptional regulator [Roseisalinus antarcticus]SLN25532.1 HTH-type transcriptional regulator DegA [Roseisalinus antarcticus]